MCCLHKGHTILDSTLRPGLRLTHWLTSQEGGRSFSPPVFFYFFLFWPMKEFCRGEVRARLHSTRFFQFIDAIKFCLWLECTIMAICPKLLSIRRIKYWCTTLYMNDLCFSKIWWKVFACLLVPCSPFLIRSIPQNAPKLRTHEWCEKPGRPHKERLFIK